MTDKIINGDCIAFMREYVAGGVWLTVSSRIRRIT